MSHHKDELIWRIAGGSGDGIDSTGTNFTKTLMRLGLNVETYRHYPSRIRGGHTYFEVRANSDEVKARSDEYNILLSLGDSFGRAPDEEAYYGNEEIKPLTENLKDLAEGGVIIYDEGIIDKEDLPEFQEKVEKNNWHVYSLNLREIAKEHGREVMRNTAGVGATAAVANIPLDAFEEVMEDGMSGDILESNIAVLHDAYEQVQERYDLKDEVEMPEGSHSEEQTLIAGSHGISFGALDEGCRFISGYPMTPWTDVFTLMSQYLSEFGGVSEQVEDEIAAASMAIGASHAGAKAMSGSSGGGFALMSEPLGMAEATETPVVLVEAMRGGPSTGLPTKTEQSDLEHVLYTSQGDSLRVVFAPGTPEEAYDQTRQAFRIAYNYNLPAIILYDKELSGTITNVDKSFFDKEVNPDLGAVIQEDEIPNYKGENDQDFPRFKLDADNGVSKRTIPGMKDGRFKTTGNEHNEYGYISEDPVNRTRMVDRRLEKFHYIREELDEENNQTYYGDESASYGIVSFGSNQGVVEEAIDRMDSDGASYRALNISELVPFPVDEVSEFIESHDRIFVVENNASAQLRHHLQRELGAYGEKLISVLKYDGTPFRPRDVVNGVESVVEGVDINPDYNLKIRKETTVRGTKVK